MLVDLAKIKVKAGNGGDGHVSFRREKNIARGGPDGGDGGDGGSVYIVADHNLATLADFRKKTLYKAPRGEPGGKKNMTGVSGEDLFIKVPAGTLVYEFRGDREVLVGDLVKDGDMLLVARGGIGGKGNTRFKSSVNQAPRQFVPGTLGEEKELKLEVKLIADVGLVGLPNAGKSTLINQLTSAHAEIGSYPFTTLTPNLGVCRLSDNSEIVVADIPGLIEGASVGKGLGDEFLRHVERTRILVHLIGPDLVADIPSKAWEDYKVIRKELGDYSTKLLAKEEIIAINKLDITEVREAFDEIKDVFAKEKLSVLGISAVTGEGIGELKNAILRVLERVPPISPFEVPTPVKTYTLDTLPNKRMVFKKPSVVEA